MKLCNYEYTQDAKQYGIGIGVPCAAIAVTATTVGLLMKKHLFFLVPLALSTAAAAVTLRSKREIWVHSVEQGKKWCEKRIKNSDELTRNFPNPEFSKLENFEHSKLQRSAYNTGKAMLRDAPTVVPTVGLALGYTIALTSFVVGHFAFPRLVAGTSGLVAGLAVGIAVTVLPEMTLKAKQEPV